MKSCRPATNPPMDGMVFEREHVRMSISPRGIPKCSWIPWPVFPRTPREWASSTRSQAPYFLQISMSSGTGAISPSMLYTASTMTSFPRYLSSASFRIRSRSSRSLCSNHRNSAPDSLHPSMRLAWASLSLITASPLPKNDEMVATLARNPLLKTMESSVFMKSAILFSRST